MKHWLKNRGDPSNYLSVPLRLSSLSSFLPSLCFRKGGVFFEIFWYFTQVSVNVLRCHTEPWESHGFHYRGTSGALVKIMRALNLPTFKSEWISTQISNHIEPIQDWVATEICLEFSSRTLGFHDPSWLTCAHVFHRWVGEKPATRKRSPLPWEMIFLGVLTLWRKSLGKETAKKPEGFPKKHCRTCQALTSGSQWSSKVGG